MSEEKKINAQECLALDQEELDQVTGGEAKRIKMHCPFCGSERYYSYTVTRPDGTQVLCFRCPDCNYTEHKK